MRARPGTPRRAPSGTPRVLPLLAALSLLALCLVASAPAATLREKLDATQGKLSKVRESQSSLSASIAEQNKAIDAMLGEVSRLRQRQVALEGELAAKQRELDRASAKLAAEKRRLARIRARLRRALGVLRQRLVAIYEAGSPDVLSVVVDSASWSQLNARTEYLSRVQDYDDAVAERVKGLRDEAKAAVRRMAAIRRQLKEARDAIAAKEREAAAAKRQAAARFADLKAAQAQRRARLESLESREQALSDNLAAISSQIASAGPAPSAAAPAPLTPGQSADYISESQASVPSGAPPAVAAAIEAANSIATTPYVWGGGHGSFESSGYDCSGAVSFALHGGGLLDSPLDSTGLETWGEAGAGQWITVYANAGHAWVIIAGLAFDTSGGAGPRWHPSPVSSTAGFVARHPPGY
jgi:septal ring factor EnvC (AmiA/AmiB activator)